MGSTQEDIIVGQDLAPIGLGAHLKTLLPQDSRAGLRDSVIPSLIGAIGEIARALHGSHRVSLAGTANAFGDDQLNVDVLAEDILRSALARTPPVVTASSEEDPVERPVRGPGGTDAAMEEKGEEYTVAFDPLDGSSIIAPNWTVGTIIGVWDGPTALGQQPSSRQVAAVLGVYGPRTTAIVALRVPGAGGSGPACFEVAIDRDGPVSVVRPAIKLAETSGPATTRYFAPANLRAAAEDERYMAVVARYIRDRYTLRYSGGLVPDVLHALIKGHGVYISPITGGSKAKLRRLFELCPVALVVECCGGKAVDPAHGRDILETALGNCDERAGLVCGTAEEVDSVSRALLA